MPPPLGRPQSLVGIKDGVLHVQVDLLAANGETIALGFLSKGAFLVTEFLATQAALEQIAAAQKASGEKSAIELALKR